MKTGIFLLIILFIFASPVHGEMYKWIDEKGTVHFTDDISKIPEKYRSDAETRKSTKEISAPESTEKLKPVSSVPLQSLSDPEGIEVSLARSGEVWLTEVLLNQRVKRNFVVDSGASFMLIDYQTAKELDISLDENTAIIPISTVSGSILAPFVTLKNVKVGKAELENVETIVHTMPSSREGLLGNSFLNKYRVVLDSNTGKMTLSSFKGIPSPDRPGGYGKDFWVNQFRFYRGYLELLKKIRKNYENRGTSSGRSEINRIDRGIQYFENQLNELDRKASFAGVPRNWRE